MSRSGVPPPVLGIDIGGTKTHLALAVEGQIVAQRIVPTADWRRREPEADVARVAAIGIALGERPVALAAGAHGCDTDHDCVALQARMADAFACPVLVRNDSELLLPAAGFSEGINLVAGTGSIAVARLPDGPMIAAGGWGWVIGDEGSASGLVREAARAVRRAVDDGGELDALGDALVEALAVPDQSRLGSGLLRLGTGAEVGRLAPLVFAAADAGSSLAVRVIDEGGQALAGFVQQVVRRGGSSRRVVAAGGVIVQQPRLWDAFRGALAVGLPQTDAILLRAPPVFGALRLATQLLNPSRPIEAITIGA